MGKGGKWDEGKAWEYTMCNWKGRQGRERDRKSREKNGDLERGCMMSRNKRKMSRKDSSGWRGKKAKDRGRGSLV